MSDVSCRFTVKFARDLLVKVALATTVAACGGGGGGGSSQGSGDYGVRVLHAAIDATPVDVLSTASGSAVRSQAVFAGNLGYGAVPKVAQTITLTRAFTPSVVLDSFDITVTSKERYSILFYGDNHTFGLRTRLIEDKVPETISGSAVRVVHGATRAAGLSASIGGTPTDTIAFGQNSPYVSVPVGQVTITAARASDGAVVASLPATLAAGKGYTFLVAGEVGYYVKGILFEDS